MSSAMMVPNAIIWAQLQILGGMKRLISISMIYGTLVFGCLLAFRYFDTESSLTQYCDGALYVITFVQGLILIVGGSNTVHRAVTRDITSQMLESHRLAPMRARSVVLGYMFGSTLQMTMLFGVGVVTGMGLIQVGSKVGQDEWIFGNLYLFMTAVMAWSASVLLAIGPRKPVSPIGLLIGLSALGPVGMFVPAVGLCLGTYLGIFAASWMVGDPVAPLEVLVAAVLAGYGLLMTLIWASAAARKFSNPNAPVFGVVGGLGLMALWLVTNVGALWLISNAELGSVAGTLARKNMGDLSEATAIIGIPNACGAMALALIALGGAANVRLFTCRGGDSTRRTIRGAPVIVPMVATLMIVAGVALTHPDANGGAILEVAIAILASLIAVEGLLTLLLSRRGRVFGILLIYLVVFWVAPPLVDAMRAEMAWDHFTQPEPVYSALLACSPIGTLVVHTTVITASTSMGLAIQITQALLFSMLGYRMCDRIRLKTASALQTTS